ncbi:MAG TPA: TonB-dependent receptor [Caulobacteraceae bacterium]|jgi:hypothetical protein
MSIRTLAAGAAIGVLTLAASSAFAQEITGGVAGRVTEDGKPVANAQVDVKNTGTGVTVSTKTAPNGFYSVLGLPPGGPYTVTATAPDNNVQTEDVDQVPIGAPYDVNINLGAAVTTVTVTGARTPVVRNAAVATGPRETFSAKDISLSPSFARDIHDLVRMNPFVTVDEANSNALIIAGSNNHTNTLYVDGVRVSDDFGLNNNGYPTQRSPFSLGIVGALNLEIAPYDVQYGDFTGGLLNVVTKSGTNVLHGSADYEYDSSSLDGKVVGANAIAIPGATDRAVTTKFEDQDSAVTIGGPIWGDHIFFFFSYDRYQSLASSSFTPVDLPGANVVAGVNSSEAATVQTVLSTASGTALTSAAGNGVTSGNGYGYNPLNFGGSAPALNSDYFAKIDWYLTDKQHLFVTYLQTDGTAYNTPDGTAGSSSFPRGELNFASSDYLQAQNLTAYTADLTSQWTHNFSTEAEYVNRDVESPSQLLTGPFANFSIVIPTVSGNPAGTGGTIDLGPDISRQSNNLGVKDQQVKLRGHYTLGDNVITGGVEWEQLATFDLFLQRSTGVYTFNNTCGPGLGNANGEFINLAAHVACQFAYANTASGNPLDAAQTAYNDTTTGYIEDEWHAMPGLTVTGGVRYEVYNTGSIPITNPRFVKQYGFSNAGTINGENVIMPRFGFNWKPDPSLTVTGGFGLFSGGNPEVYTYNSYDTTGNLVGGPITYKCIVANCGTAGVVGSGPIGAETSTGATALTPVLVGVTGSSIPAAAQTDIANSTLAGSGNANALDPNFKPPQAWKGSLSIVKLVDFTDMGGGWDRMKWLGDGWRIHGDLLITKTVDSVEWIDLFEQQNKLTASSAAALGIASPTGLAPDGRPLFSPARYGMTVPGTGPGTTLAAQVRSGGAFDIELTDTNKGDSLLWAIGLGKHWPFGLDIDYTFTGQHVRDVTLAGSSVASSNLNNNIVADPTNPDLATSNYQILFEHRLTFDFEHNFIPNYRTAVRVGLYERAGLPFSYSFCTTGASSNACALNGAASASTAPVEELFGQYENGTSNQLLYVPKTSGGVVTATSDPAVTFAPGFDLAGFNDFLKSSGLLKYSGQIAPRNAFRSGDYGTGDLQVSQELPALYPKGAKGEFYFDVINFLNLIDKNWGIDNEVPFPYTYAPVVAYNCQWSGQTFNAGTTNSFTMPTCVAGKGNFYQYQAFRGPLQNNYTQVQTSATALPQVPTWVIKLGVRYKF